LEGSLKRRCLIPSQFDFPPENHHLILILVEPLNPHLPRLWVSGAIPFGPKGTVFVGEAKLQFSSSWRPWKASTSSMLVPFHWPWRCGPGPVLDGGLMSSVQWVWPITVSICMDLMQSADFQLHKFTVMLAAPNMNKHSFLSCQPRSDKQWLIDKVGTLKCDSVIHHKYGPSDDQIVIWHSRRPLWLNSILNQFSLDTDLFVLFRSSRISSGRTSRC
jgi:hypothetical protein